MPSEWKDPNRLPSVISKRREVVLVCGQYRCPCRSRNDDQVGINHIRGSGGSEQGSDVMCLVGGECDDVTAPQEASELDLPI